MAYYWLDYWLTERNIEREKNSILKEKDFSLGDIQNYALLKEYLKPTDILLDYGCGSGRFSYFLDKHYFQYLGVDINPTVIQVAKDRYPEKYNSKYKVLDLNEEKPFKENYFTKAICVSLMQHLPENECVNIFEKVHTALKPSGEFLVIDARFYSVESDKFATAEHMLWKNINDMCISIKHLFSLNSSVSISGSDYLYIFKKV